MRAAVLILLAACTASPQSEGEALTRDDGIRDATLPPPTAITLEAPEFAPVDRPFRVAVPDALSDEVVFFVAGAGEGDGPCPRPLGGYCMSLLPPLAFVGRADTDDEGGAVAEIDALRFPGSLMCYQAVIRRGPEGLASAFSNVACVDFCPDVDSDGDGRCDEYDICVGDSPTDADGDGRCDDIDICDGGDDALDTDDDTVPDFCDVCLGDDSSGDTDSDGTCDAIDPCPIDPLDDSDGDSICDSEDICPGGDDALDSDDDGVPDACDGPPRGLYAAEGRRGNYGSDFFFIDVDTSTVTYVATLPYALTGLAFDRDGILWGIEANGIDPSRIAQIDPATGSLTTISTASSGYQPSAFSFSADGTLWGWTENGDDMIRIDPWTGATDQYSVGIGTSDNCAALLDGNWIMKSGTSFYDFGADPGALSYGGLPGGIGSSYRGNGCTALDGYMWVARADQNLQRCDPYAGSCTDMGIWIADGIDALAGWE